jgi:hypothetical protein
MFGGKKVRGQCSLMWSLMIITLHRINGSICALGISGCLAASVPSWPAWLPGWPTCASTCTLTWTIHGLLARPYEASLLIFLLVVATICR